MEDTSGLSDPGHYNKVALLMRWPLSEVYCTLYFSSTLNELQKSRSQTIFGFISQMTALIVEVLLIVFFICNTV